jgi:hypothetical protein
MAYIYAIFAALFLLTAIVFFIVGHAMRTQEKNFADNCRSAVGTVVGYRQIDFGDDIPKISFRADGNDVRTEAKSSKMNARTHPVGTQVRILYIPKRIFGADVYDVRINESGYTSRVNVVAANVFSLIAALLFLTALIFFVIIMMHRSN